MIGIYKITSPTKKVYIGQSIDIEDRFKCYKRLKCKGQVILYASFLKYGVENHKFEILIECEIIELNEKERYYQDLYSCIDKNGMNCILTKSSDRSGKLSEITKKKMSEAQKSMPPKNDDLRKNHSEKMKKNISNSNKLRLLNERNKKKVGVFCFNSDEKLHEFESIRECSRILGYDRKSISLSCRNVYNYAYGLSFRFI